MAAVPTRAPDRRRVARCSSCATSTPATGRSARCSACRSTLQPGRVLALLGSNGAGKTTVARVCSGLHRADRRARCCFDGADVTGLAAVPSSRGSASCTRPRAARCSRRSPSRRTSTLTFRAARPRAASAAALDEAYELFPRLGERRQQLAGTLSGGEQRMLSLARVLVEQPRLLIADELSLGLAPIIVDEVYRTLETIRDAGTTLLIVEQHVHHALAHRRRRVVLRQGRGRVLGPGRRARRPAGTRARRRPVVVDADERCSRRTARRGSRAASVSTIASRSTSTWPEST